MTPAIGLCHLLLVVLAAYLTRWQLMPTEAIVVDGSRKGPSAKANQSHEAEMIDVYNTKTCGISDPDEQKSDFVNAAKPGEFPWLASLQLTPTCTRRFGVRDNYSLCMGAFISETWVLTAAHCFVQPEQNRCLHQGHMMVFAGSTNINSPNNANFAIKRAFVHKMYNNSIKVGFDVALLELATPARLSQKYGGKEPFINTVCLPITGKDFSEGQAVKIAGWGKTEYGNDHSMPDNLLTTDLYLTNATRCSEIFSSRKRPEIRNQYAKYRDFVCAEYNGKRDACQGDSGSPMLEYADGKAVAIGIVSYGLGCAKKGYPGVYERVSSLMPWIKDITQKKEKSKMLHIVLKNESL